MKYQEYNPIKGSGCVIRTFMKLLDKEYEPVKIDLQNIAKELGFDNINEIKVFDEYFKRNQFQKEEVSIPVSDLDLLKGKYGVFCFKEEDYHMFAIVDGVIYDKNQNYLDMKTIAIYEYKK